MGKNSPFILDDPRLVDILFETPLDVIDMWARPWIEARMFRGYPVEYRVFVRSGAVVAVSSYYPQRALDYCEREIAQVMSMTETLIEALGGRTMVYPLLLDDGADWSGVNFTADYLVGQDGEVLWLESGPPFGKGAHPCCFLRESGVLEVRGLALAAGVADQEGLRAFGGR